MTRPKGYPLPSETSPARSAFLVGAGVILVLGGLALSFKIFNTKDEPVALATNVSAPRSPHFPPEVVKLVADTEVAFQQDNFKTARTDVAALQQIAPDHPRLPFFESLLKRLDATNRDASAESCVGQDISKVGRLEHASLIGRAGSRRNPTTTATPRPRLEHLPRREHRPPPVSTTTVATFAGRTLEDSSPGTAATQRKRWQPPYRAAPARQRHRRTPRRRDSSNTSPRNIPRTPPEKASRAPSMSASR